MILFYVAKIKKDYVKNLLNQKFKTKDVGEIKPYLGINIEYKNNKYYDFGSNNIYWITGEKVDIEHAKLYETPLEQNLKCEPAQSVSEDLNYRNLIGALLYVSSGTRPDISYSVNYLSRFQNSYELTHYKYAIRILK